jgi:hypothetical protein
MSQSPLLSLARLNASNNKDPQITAMQSSNTALLMCQPRETASVHPTAQENLKSAVNDSIYQVQADDCPRGFLVVPAPDKLKRIQPASPCPFFTDKAKYQSAPSSTITCITPPKKRNVRVRFDEQRNEFYRNTQIFKEDLNDQWYTTHDNEDFKEVTNAFLREVILEDKRNKARYSFRRVVLRAYDACCESVYETDESLLSKDEEFYLTRWFSLASNLVGVERWAVRQIRQDVKNRKSLLLDRVLAIQKMGRKVAIGGHDDDDDDDNAKDARNEFLDTQADFLKKSCEAISRPSRLFARHMGKAQAASIIDHDDVV